MSVSACTDDNPPVEYLFECTTNGAFSSGWQTGTTYTAEGLSPSTLYTFRVKARDSAAGQNETGWTSEESATTEPPGENVEVLGNWLSGLSHAAEDGELRLLIFTAHAEHNATILLTSVTYGGQTMTKINEQVAGSTNRIFAAAFYLDEAGIRAASNSTFVPTWSASPSSAGYASVFLGNVDQTVPIGARDTNGSASSTPNPITTAALLTEDGDLAIVAGACGNMGDYTVNNGFAKGTELSISSADGVVGHKAGTGSTETPSLTHSAVNRQVILGFVVQGAAYEWLYGDFTEDGTVDLADLPGFVEYWLAEDCGPVDVNEDCRINLEELAEFARNWMW
jgi:hypothetical protein